MWIKVDLCDGRANSYGQRSEIRSGIIVPRGLRTRMLSDSWYVVDTEDVIYWGMPIDTYELYDSIIIMVSSSIPSIDVVHAN